MHVVLLVYLLCTQEMADFTRGQQAFNDGHYSIAEAYFEAVLAEGAYSEYRSDILYYLVRIADAKEDFPRFLSSATQFISDYTHDKRSIEVFDILIQHLNQKRAFAVSAEYVKEYSYLITDQSIIQEIVLGLLGQQELVLADSLLLCYPQTDTIKIMRASIIDDATEKKTLYSSIPGAKGKIYLMEFYLEQGDTIDAFEVFGSVVHGSVEEELLFRYARISRLFDKKSFTRTVDRLDKVERFRNKARLLRALETGQLDVLESPLDEAESSLLALYVMQDTVSRGPPELINIDSVLVDSLAMIHISRAHKEMRNYIVDSTYADMLIRNGRYDEAREVIEPYIHYHNTNKYARMVRALQFYQSGSYIHAARDIVLSRVRTPEWLYILANSFKHLQRESDYLYREVIDKSRDSALVHRAARELIKLDFSEGRYADVLTHGFETVEGDTHLVELYAYSLARNGQYDDGVALASQYSIEKPYTLANHYCEYLVENKKYSKARMFYDSIITGTNVRLPSRLYYNWALVPFLQGKVDTAMARFQYYRKVAPNSEDYYHALFKIATLYYTQQEFDSAAYYYGLASEDDSLRVDALQNQLVCLKKSSRWADVVDVGTPLLELVPEEEKHDVTFELGYAFLRSGHIRQAVDFLKTAVRLNPSPEYYYWLAETYLGKGDFIRALYHYQKIVDAFTEDEMWTPTAHYKTGIVLEFLDALDEAQAVYEQIIKERGRSDTWGIEAQKRMEALRQGKR